MTTTEYLLSTHFPKCNLEALQSLINATGNSELALQILLAIQDSSWNEGPTESKKIGKVTYTPTSYDPWKQEVKVSYTEQTRRYGQPGETEYSKTSYSRSEDYPEEVYVEKISHTSFSLKRWEEDGEQIKIPFH
jgi:hypothetical protein